MWRVVDGDDASEDLEAASAGGSGGWLIFWLKEDANRLLNRPTSAANISRQMWRFGFQATLVR